MIRDKNDLPWLVRGDFNLRRVVEDTTANIRNYKAMLDFNAFIGEAGLVEAPLQGRAYTWSNRRPNPTFSKLDRIFLSYHWNNLGASFDLKDLPTTASDHTPLFL